MCNKVKFLYKRIFLYFGIATVSQRVLHDVRIKIQSIAIFLFAQVVVTLEVKLFPHYSTVITSVCCTFHVPCKVVVIVPRTKRVYQSSRQF